MATVTTNLFPGNANVNEQAAILEVWSQGSPLQGTSTHVSTTYVNASGVLLELSFFGSGFGTANAVVNAVSIATNDLVTLQASGLNEYLSTISNLLNQSVSAGSLDPLTNFLATNYDTNFVGSETADNIVGWQGDDVISARGGNDTIYGMQDNDDIFAGSGDDLAYGGSGADIIGGGEGNDLLAGESGSDTLFGGNGNDVLHAGYVNGSTADAAGIQNVIWAGSGNDLLNGDDTSDILGGGVGDDTVYGFAGNDLIYGGQDSASDPGRNDLIDGDAGNDTIYAGNGADEVHGGIGDDLIYSGSQNDSIAGGSGQDYIWGGAGDDHLYGGTTTAGDGAIDVFAFQTGSGDDRVYDFEVGLDYLDLRFAATEFVTPQDVVAASTQFSNGVLINLGGGDSVFLDGVSQADLFDSNYFF